MQLFNKTTRKHNEVLNGVYQDKIVIAWPLMFYMLWFGCFTGDSLKQKNLYQSVRDFTVVLSLCNHICLRHNAALPKREYWYADLKNRPACSLRKPNTWSLALLCTSRVLQTKKNQHKCQTPNQKAAAERWPCCPLLRVVCFPN